MSTPRKTTLDLTGAFERIEENLTPDSHNLYRTGVLAWTHGRIVKEEFVEIAKSVFAAVEEPNRAPFQQIHNSILVIVQLAEMTHGHGFATPPTDAKELRRMKRTLAVALPKHSLSHYLEEEEEDFEAHDERKGTENAAAEKEGDTSPNGGGYSIQIKPRATSSTKATGTRIRMRGTDPINPNSWEIRQLKEAAEHFSGEKFGARNTRTKNTKGYSLRKKPGKDDKDKGSKERMAI
ncbi:hypothetical protein GQ43DRAFT_461638 [Delitschia confertaspora ATCC 74209]|uniref:Uncharacterized protein n=1 Tax=Delitschia confertaspora ATCC 74209 TaxID=1513339 RepID=A0A9P4MUT0_9PLEO|nr:hypothetical protein GQ43DRAFT_461638 [Delitschia confertaspora ATCC 74209]